MEKVISYWREGNKQQDKQLCSIWKYWKHTSKNSKKAAASRRYPHKPEVETYKDAREENDVDANDKGDESTLDSSKEMYNHVDTNHDQHVKQIQ